MKGCSNLGWTPKGFEAPAEGQQALESFMNMHLPISREGAEILGGFIGTDPSLRPKRNPNGLQRDLAEARADPRNSDTIQEENRGDDAETPPISTIAHESLPDLPLAPIMVTQGPDLWLACQTPDGIARDPQLHHHPTTATRSNGN